MEFIFITKQELREHKKMFGAEPRNYKVLEGRTINEKQIIIKEYLAEHDDLTENEYNKLIKVLEQRLDGQDTTPILDEEDEEKGTTTQDTTTRGNTTRKTTTRGNTTRKTTPRRNTPPGAKRHRNNNNRKNE